MTWNDDSWQALLNICYPLSQQYTAKKVHVPPQDVYYYYCSGSVCWPLNWPGIDLWLPQ